jgi:hypothetical protein
MAGVQRQRNDRVARPDDVSAPAHRRDHGVE